jgi:hypothetical protein
MVIALALVACPVSAGDGWITGTVSRSGGSGDPIPGATVTLSGTSSSVSTDSNGNYNIKVPAGDCTLQVSASGFNSQTSGALTVTEGNTTGGIDFHLEKPSGNLTGTVTDVDDETPIPGATISYPSGGPPAPTVQTDSGGRYLLSGLPVGTLTINLTISPPYENQSINYPIKAGVTSTKDFKLKAITHIAITVKGSGGKPLPGATVDAVGSTSTITNTTDPSGLAILEVGPGTYNVEVTAEGYTTAKLTILAEKGKTTPSTVSISKTGGGGGTNGGGSSMLLVAGAAAAVVVVLGVVAFMMIRKKKKASAGNAAGPAGTGSAPAPGAPAAPGQQSTWDTEPVSGRPKTEAEKRKEWADFERMYGRPHPEAPGWVGGAASLNAPKPKCPIDDVAVSYEPYSGMYFCSKCHERYPAERVFGQEQAPPQPAQAPRPQYHPPPEPQYVPSGPQQQPSWAAQVPATDTMAAPASPPTAAPMEAQPVAGYEQVPEAKPREADVIPPGTGPVFNLPPPVSYEDGTVPPPPHKPPEENQS